MLSFETELLLIKLVFMFFLLLKFCYGAGCVKVSHLVDEHEPVEGGEYYVHLVKIYRVKFASQIGNLLIDFFLY